MPTFTYVLYQITGKVEIFPGDQYRNQIDAILALGECDSSSQLFRYDSNLLPWEVLSSRGWINAMSVPANVQKHASE